MALEQDQQHRKGTRVGLSDTACGRKMKTDVTTVLVPKLEPQDNSDPEAYQDSNAEDEEMIAECASAKRNLEEGTSASSSASTEGNNSPLDVRDQIKFCRYYRKDNQNQSYFARHMLYHAKGKRYCCKHCSKIFACPTNYSLHKLFHSREKYQNSGVGTSAAQTGTDIQNQSSRLSNNAYESPSKLPNNTYESPFKKSNQGGIDYERSRQICETEILRSTNRMRLKNPSAEQVQFKIKLPLSTSSGPTSQDGTQGGQPGSQQGSSASTQEGDDQRLCSSDHLASQDSSTSTSCSNTQTVSTNSDTSNVQEMSPFNQTTWQQNPSVSPFSASQNVSMQGCYNTPNITSLATNLSDNFTSTDSCLQPVPSVCVDQVIQGLCGSDQANNMAGACNNSIATPLKEMTSPLVTGQPMQVNGGNLAPSNESQQNQMSQSTGTNCNTFENPVQESNQGGMNYEHNQGMCENNVLGNPNIDGVQYNGKLPMSYTPCPVTQNNIQGMLGMSHPVTQQYISQDTSSCAKTLMSANCGAGNVQEIPPSGQPVWQESQGIPSASQNNSIQGSYASNPATVMPQSITSWATNHSGTITLTNGTQTVPSIGVKQEVQGLCESNPSVALANNITSHNAGASSVSETTVPLPVAQFKQEGNNSVTGAVSYVSSGIGQGVQGYCVGGLGSSVVPASFMSTVCAKQKIKELPANEYLSGQVRSVNVPSMCGDQRIVCLPTNEMFSNAAQSSVVQCSRTKSLVRLLPKAPVTEKCNSTPQQVVQQSVQWPVQMASTGQQWMNVQVLPSAMVNNNNNNNMRTVMMNNQTVGLTNEECINQDSAVTHMYPKTAQANMFQPAGQINFQPAPFWQQASPMMPSPQVVNVVPMGMSPGTQFVVLNPTFPMNSFGQYLPAPFTSVANQSYSLPVMFVQNQIQLQGNSLVMGGNQTWLPGQGGVIHP